MGDLYFKEPGPLPGLIRYGMLGPGTFAKAWGPLWNRLDRLAGLLSTNLYANHALNPQGAAAEHCQWHTDATNPNQNFTHMLSCVLADKICGCGTVFRAGIVEYHSVPGEILLAPLTLEHRPPHCWSHNRAVLRIYLEVKG